ncbi:MAG: glycosyltransferase [Actinomycetota bacterium]|nr:glycosyltransferase [Actinomycetota bacterium]
MRRDRHTLGTLLRYLRRRLHRLTIDVHAAGARRRSRLPRLCVLGEPWFATLLSSSATVTRGRRRVDGVVFGPGFLALDGDATGRPPATYRADGPTSAGVVVLDPAPFVAADAVFRRRHRRIDGAPADILAANEAARRTMPELPGSEGAAETWMGEAAAAHRRYRDAYGRHSAMVVAEIVEPASGAAPDHRRDGVDVSVLCVTNRPQRLADVVGNYERQSCAAGELVIVAHGDGFDDERLSEALTAVPNARWVRAPGAWSLGACLNHGLDQCRARRVAKFDDDDLYGEHYLADAVLSSVVSGAAVVGKRSYVAHLTATDRLILRFPGEECRPSAYLAGGTLVIDRDQLGGVRFPDLTVGEDQGLIRSLRRAGRWAYAGDMFNYVQCRGDDNTWRADEQQLRRRAVDLGASDRIDGMLI